MERKEFTSIEEAFEALSEPVREHSLRVEKYAELLFLELCAAEEYMMNIHSRVRLRADNRSLVRLAARYHDIGKVLVPEFYQWDDPEYTPEERALYRRHCLAGDELVHRISQQQTVPPMTVDIICESIANHHECWDGSGYPNGRSEEHTAVIGRIVAVANELDHYLMNTRSEAPVNTAVDLMMEGSGTLYDPIVMGLVYDAKHKIERIFAQYRAESRAIPQAMRIIRRKTKRPMWLEYRPIAETSTKKAYAMQADMRFKRGKEIIGYAAAEPLLKKNKKLQDAGMCFAVEALDTARRMKTCEVGGRFVALNCVTGFFKKRGMANALGRLVESTDGDVSMLVLVPDAADLTEIGANAKENCKRLTELGIGVMCRGVALSSVDPEVLAECGIRYFAITPEDIENFDENREKLIAVAEKGIVLMGGDIDKHKHLTALSENGIDLAFGDHVGEYVDEESFIADELRHAQ